MSDREAEIAPVHVLSGDALLVDRRIEELRAAVVAPATRAFNHDVFEAKAAGPSAILSAARTLPMMGRRRLVVVRDAETLGAEGLEPFGAYLADPAPSTVLVLQCGKVDGRLKFFQAAKKRGFLHDLTAPRQILPWIEAEARRRGARLAGEAARRLAEIAGKDLGRLAQAIDQLALYVADGEAVTAADVDELVAETRERTVFELTHAVGASDRAGALGAVARLFDQRESPIGVAMMLARHFRQLGLAQEAAQGGARRADLPRLLGVPPFAVDGLMAQAKKLAPGAVPRAIALLARADRDLKGPKKGAVGERIVLERLIGELLDATSPRRP